jgi:hypothetical protein
MSRYPSTVRYYSLVGAYGISIGFLLISAFAVVGFLNPERRGSGNQYPAWIFGSGSWWSAVN